MDKYDKAVEHLTENPDEIKTAWLNAKPLFKFCAPADWLLRHDGQECGCLTQVRSGEDIAWTDELTAAIRNDERLPSSPSEIKVHHLPVFAEWQRKLDIELQRS